MMTAIEITPFPYHPTPLKYFTQLRRRPNAVLLDSGRPEAPGGRYDILSSDPLAMLEVDTAGKVSGVNELEHLAPFAAQQALLDRLNSDVPPSELPFLGGLIGYWAYDLGQPSGTEKHPPKAPQAPQPKLPASRVGLYDWALLQDHHKAQSWLVASAKRRQQVETWLTEALASDDESQSAYNALSDSFQLTDNFTADMSKDAYLDRFNQVQRYIRAGDCYQINLAQRFSAPYQGDPWQAYQLLRQATPTPYAGYLAWNKSAVLSLSPERFIRSSNGQVETRPIKGTRPRGTHRHDDQRLAESLVHSTKDRAENVMIVDLLRNDLGQVCRTGSVQVPQLCGLESYANVHHLVSVVTGQLAEGQRPLDLLAAAFPGGSITGAPKVRAMQIINELEPSTRSVYCGSLGYVDCRGNMDTSIAIRTAVLDRDLLHLWGGGGLVADSEGEDEYAETLDKIRHLMTALKRNNNQIGNSKKE
ncbi:aminodeoxychorismate synthase component I [Halomonas halocynthiae]|uniref:aminodeoxychorismate synthase component I n=1 Tax=Halomonas halocynthiae TaxID=176290 RepID=UPI00054D118F